MKPTVSCILCKSVVTVNNISRHYGSKLCQQGKKFTDQMDQCPHCNENLLDKKARANHIRWCDKNPKRELYKNDMAVARSAITNQSRASAGQKIKQLHDNGHYNNVDRSWFLGKTHSDETRKKISEKALASDHQRKMGWTHTYTDKQGRTFQFDSRWEDVLADRLDELNLNWYRPDPVPYTDKEGKSRKYFPDFYLPDYDLYLDPKNSYVEECQRDKLEIVSKLITLVILRSENECKMFSLD